MRDKCSLSRVTIVTRQEVNMQRECTLSSNTAFSSIVLWKNALFLSFILVYCSTNSDKYNIENFAFKDKTFEFHVPTLQSQSISVLEFKTSLFDEHKWHIKQRIFYQMERPLCGILLKLRNANGTNGKAMLRNLLEVLQYHEIRDFRHISTG